MIDEYRWDSEKRGRQQTDAQYSASLREWIEARKPTAWYVDPSAASFILQLRSDHDWHVVPADNDVLNGLRFVGKRIAAGDVRVLHRCSGLMGEIESYVWDERAQKRGEDKPLKANDHGPDALRYGMYTHLSRARNLAEYGWVA